MAIFAGEHRSKRWFPTMLLLVVSIGGLVSPAVVAQQATAAINGVVKDQTGAAIPNARVDLTNVNTAVVRTTSTNSDGLYAFPSVLPGAYSLQVSASGFTTVQQAETTLQVNQTATFDFQLKVGTTQQNVTVNATEGAALETATSELGTVVAPDQVANLPLNGRNFTQLLTITAGVANINRDQSQYGGGGWAGNSIGSFTFPAINGARNRSNYFMLDGANDLNTMLGMYNYSPVVDAIQEFKTQGHNDLAEYGGVAGGIVSVVTKSGTNQYHGSLWEFLRNDAMDARGYFESTLPPLRQNQYGASAGGPVWIPKLYNGRNRTFFYAAWEGYRYRSANTTGVLGPTDPERNGDFSALSVPIYDPATTKLDPATGTYSRSVFPGNIIPSNRIDPISALYQTLVPHVGPLVNGNNIYSSGPQQTNQDTGTARGDQNFGNNNQVMFRYSQFDQQVANTTNIIGNNTIHVFGHNYIGHYTHTFSPTTFSDVYFGRNYGDTITGTLYPSAAPSFLSQLQTLGMSKFWMTLNNTLYAPQWNPDGYFQFNGSQLQETGLGDNWQFGGSFTKMIGKHTIKAGADFQSNNFRSPIAYSNEGFGVAQTAGLGAQQGVGGNAWASLLLGVPASGGYRNILEVANGGWIDGVYVQDQIKATSHLTVNLGYRQDLVWTPIYGTGNAGNFYTGEAIPTTGEYILNALPADCSATQGAPCIPTGTYTASSTPAPGGLPPHAVVSPTRRMIQNSFGDWAGRFGLAYRFGNKTVARASYTRFYDAWATVVQLSQNFGGNWPAVNTIQNNGLNSNVQTAPSNDPLGLGNGGALVYPINDFSQVSQWMVDPKFRTPYMDQWNLGVQRELPGNMVLDANYVGSAGRHLDWGPTMNTPSPGPGDIQSRRPYPYMLQQWFDQSVGVSSYNAMQVTVTKRTGHGVTFLVAYTLAHAKDDGCGLGASCNSSNPYHRASDYGTSDSNQANAFSAAFTLQSPFGSSSNKAVAILAGGWSLNGIVQLGSGLPYTVTTGSDPENIGCCLQQRVNVVGDPNKGTGLKTPAQWFNTSAFALQTPYTYGNEKVNPWVSDWNRNVDLSLFRSFHVGLGESRYFEFRAESFNLFNKAIFAPPNSTLGGTNFGVVTQQQNHPRQLQMGLKFNY
jgi:Carboxypeptidase regulatory-like domain